MRILIVNWAKIEDGAAHGGGVNGYCQGVGLEMVRRGHEVLSLSSGTAYEPGVSTSVGPCSLRNRGLWEGIGRFEVVNSPILAPSILQFREPLAETSCPELESVFETWLRDVKPNVIHFNNVEGLSAGCIHAALRSGARVVYSLHNYHTLCPQVYLMQGHRRPCMTFDNGHACTSCIPAVDPNQEKARIASGSPRTSELPPKPFLPPPAWDTIAMPAWQPLLNIASPEPPSTKPPNDYAKRRAAMVAMLNACHRVLSVSEFVTQKFESLGVSPAVLRTLHIGSRMPELVAPASRPPAMPTAGDPIRLAFIGYSNWYKGLPMLTDSLEVLTPEYLSRVHLTILALNLVPVMPQLRRLEPRLAGLRIENGYRYEDLPAKMADIDLGVVPSVWWDNAPQTVMEFHACGIPVLGAELGGIPDFVQEGVNGLLFRGNDRWDLARRLAEVIRRPGILAELRTGVRPPKTMSIHGTELEQEYRNRIS